MVVAKEQRMGSWIGGLNNEITKKDDEIKKLKRKCTLLECEVEQTIIKAELNYDTSAVIGGLKRVLEAIK